MSDVAANPDVRQKVGVFFGGVSPEHEVSVISGLQAMAALDSRRWQAFPVYIAKNGAWWSGSGLSKAGVFKRPLQTGDDVFPVSIVPGTRGKLRLRQLNPEGPLPWIRKPEMVDLEVVIPVMHGGCGEDGSLQGLMETLGVPYAGSGPLPAALAMDKVAAKRWAADFDIPQVEFQALTEPEWAGQEEAMLDALSHNPGLPCIVKPASLGSSIGISKASTRRELDAAIEEAFRYDASVVVERAVGDLRELNCSVLGRPGAARASVLEEPLSGDELLSFRDKYMSSGSGSKGGAAVPLGSKNRAEGMASLDRQIPADIPEEMTREVRELAVRTFDAFGCQGVVRIDFLLESSTGEVFFNEINTMPGSLSFYLWEPSGVPFPELLTEILELGLTRHRENAGRIHTYDVNLLSERDLGGLKGAKS